ncbi:MAG: hypothetical protein HZA54_13905, partial [Planctomycetes bacterium]|nr:hypothetical protein [Planctomycetota bacterium]
MNGSGNGAGAGAGAGASDAAAGALPAGGSRPIALVTACRLLLGLRLRRQVHRLRAGLAAMGKKRSGAAPVAVPAARRGTAGKSRPGWASALLVGARFLFQGTMMSVQIIDGIEARLGAAALPGAAATLLSVLFVTLVTIEIGLANKELAALDSDLEWLLALPVSQSGIYLMKVVESALLNFVGWFTVAPFLAVLAFHVGQSSWVIVAAPLLALPILFLVGLARQLLETILRVACPAAILRNVQAVASIAGMVLLVLVMAPIMGDRRPDGIIWTLIRAAGDGLLWTPCGLPATVASAGVSAAGAPAALALYLLEATALLAVGSWALGRLLAGGPGVGRGLRQGAR